MVIQPPFVDANTVALQQTIELLSEINDLDQLIPRVLEIVAQVTGSISCAFFDNAASGEVRLRYWHTEGISYLPDDLLNLDPKKFALVRSLAEGFQVPDEYLGIPTVQTGTVRIDHLKGTCVPEFDHFAIETGWELELNVGVGVGEMRDMTLCIYRGRDNPYSAQEIALVESMAKQIRLAWRLAQAAEESKKAAIAMERVTIERQRADELAQANNILRGAIGRLAFQPSFGAFLGYLLREVAMALHTNTAVFTSYDIATNTFGLEALFYDGELADPAGMPESLPLPDARFANRLLRAKGFEIFDVDADGDLFWPGAAEWLRQRGQRFSASFPILVNGRLYGQISLAYPSSPKFSKDQQDLVQALSAQAALGLELARLAHAAKDAAIIQGRELAALDRISELEKAHALARKEAEERANAERIVRGNAEVINEVLTRISREAQASRHLAIVLESLVTTLKLDSAAVFRYDTSNKCNVFEVDCRSGSVAQAHESHERQLATSLSTVWDDYHLNDLKAGKVLYHDESALYEHPSFEPYRNRLRNRGVREVISAPMFCGTDYIGFFALRSKEPGILFGLDKKFVESIASQAALAVQMLRLSAKGEQAAVMEERNRIARDLHDSLAQGFTGVILNLEAAGSALDSSLYEVAATHVRAASQAARKGLEDARHSVLALRQSSFQGSSFSEALVTTAQGVMKDSAIAVKMENFGEPFFIPFGIGEEILRIVQEALINVLRYATACQVKLTLAFSEDQLRITVGDDGKGFDRDVTKFGLGIRGMFERAEGVGCDLSIKSVPDQGTLIDLRWTRPNGRTQGEI